MNNYVFDKTIAILRSQELNIIDKDINRPWGGFYVISDESAKDFLNIYFDDYDTEKVQSFGNISPKILIIAPNKRLSWQYHHRRSEIWKVVRGEINVVTSHDDKERKKLTLKEGDIIKLYQGERHRIIGKDDFSIVAEIWIHTDKNNLSDENDIVRLQDDYDRK